MMFIGRSGSNSSAFYMSKVTHAVLSGTHLRIACANTRGHVLVRIKNF